jgi:hypothetical protein
LLSGCQISPAGVLLPMETGALSNHWQSARLNQTGEFTVTPSQVRAWRERGAENCEGDRLWFAAAFHLGQLVKERPQDEKLRQRFHRAQAQRDLEVLRNAR